MPILRQCLSVDLQPENYSSVRYPPVAAKCDSGLRRISKRLRRQLSHGTWTNATLRLAEGGLGLTSASHISTACGTSRMASAFNLFRTSVPSVAENILGQYLIRAQLRGWLHTGEPQSSLLHSLN